MSQVSLWDVHLDHLPQGLDLGEAAQERRHQRALFTQATIESALDRRLPPELRFGRSRERERERGGEREREREHPAIEPSSSRNESVGRRLGTYTSELRFGRKREREPSSSRNEIVGGLQN
jgi:hypothetical protein